MGGVAETSLDATLHRIGKLVHQPVPLMVDFAQEIKVGATHQSAKQIMTAVGDSLPIGLDWCLV